jgi:glycosyltransferase involved in cell wall biosynthesis
MERGSCPGGKNEVDIIVPVLNERESIEEFCLRIEKEGFANSLIFVDNASTDGTAEWIASIPSARLIRHSRNLGYGASIRDGLAASRGRKAVIIDADLEYPPEAIPELLLALETHPVVYGSRFLAETPPEMPRLRRLGNHVISAVFNLLFRQHTSDFYTGVKALRREAIDCLDLRQNGFEHVVEMGAQLVRAGFRIAEIPVAYRLRSRGTSKMKHIPETLKYIWYISLYRCGWKSSASGRRERGVR